MNINNTPFATNNAANQSVDVLLICALKDEYDQVLAVTDNLITPWNVHTDASGWIVADGCFATKSGQPLVIRATYASYMGREQTQATASRLIFQHLQTVKCIAMSGICAGWRGKVALGDVIFAKLLWSYDAGKITVENGEQRFQGDPIQYHPSPTWVQRMEHLIPSGLWLSERPALPLEYQEDWVLLHSLEGNDPRQHPNFAKECPDWSSVLPRLWQRGWFEDNKRALTVSGRERAERLQLLYSSGLPTPGDFDTHVAPLATGAAVTEDANIFNRLADSTRKVLGVEMEASALGALGESFDIPVLVAKGVSDFGDPFKDDRYREFAARASAECLIALLRDNADLLPGYGKAESVSQVPLSDSATLLAGCNANAVDVLLAIPSDLIVLLAEQYPDVRDARSVWQRAGGKASEVENISRPRDLWQRLWQMSNNGAAVRPKALLVVVLEDLPANATLLHYLAILK